MASSSVPAGAIDEQIVQDLAAMDHMAPVSASTASPAGPETSEDNPLGQKVQGLEEQMAQLNSQQQQQQELLKALASGVQQLIASSASASPSPPSPSPSVIPANASEGVNLSSPQSPGSFAAGAAASSMAAAPAAVNPGFTPANPTPVNRSPFGSNPPFWARTQLVDGAEQAQVNLGQAQGVQVPGSLTSATTVIASESQRLKTEADQLLKRAKEQEILEEKANKEKEEQEIWQQKWLDKGWTAEQITEWSHTYSWTWPKKQEITVSADNVADPVQSPGQVTPSQQHAVEDNAQVTQVVGADLKLITVPLEQYLKNAGKGTGSNPSYLSGGNSEGQKLGWVKVPSWDGKQASLAQYKLDIRKVVANISDTELPKLAGRMITEFTDAASRYLHVEPELIDNLDYKTANGWQLLIDHMASRLGITARQEENNKFRSYFYDVRRSPGESFLSYENKEELAYRELQKSIGKANPGDTQMTDSSGKAISWFLPDNLRGWFFLERSSLTQEKKTQLILQCGGTTSLTKLKELIRETFTPAAVAGMDRANKANLAAGDQDDDSYYTEADIANPWSDHYGYFGEANDEEDDEESYDPFLDDLGYMVATEEDVQRMQEGIAAEDPEYQRALLNFTEAKDVLKKLQVARQFFPVVVPAQYFPAKAMGKGKGKKGNRKGKRGKGKGKNKGKKGLGKGKGRPNPNPKLPKGVHPAKDEPMDGSGKPAPLCFECGKPGHFSRECPEKGLHPGNKRPRVNFVDSTEWAQWSESGDTWDWENDTWAAGNYEQGYVVYDLGKAPEDTEELYCGSCIDNSNPTPRYQCCRTDHDYGFSYDQDRTCELREEQVYGTFVEDSQGCALVDTGATVGMTSANALDKLSMQTLDESNELPYSRDISPSTMGFGTASGRTRAKFQATLRTPAMGPMRGTSYPIQVVPGENNDCPILIGMDYLTKSRAVIDCELGMLLYKDTPNKVYQLNRAKNGLLMVPLTKEKLAQSMTTVTDEDVEQFKKAALKITASRS